MLVDSHCHLNLLSHDEPEQGLQQILANAKQAAVEHMLCVSVDLQSFPDVLSYAQRFSHISASVGQHPNDAACETVASVEQLVALADNDNVVAIGETGLDYFRTEPTHIPQQQQSFRQHIQAAIEIKKPLIIHTREAREDTIKLLREEGAEQVGGVMHCFTETQAMAEQAMALGFYISFSGIVTFKNAKDLQAVAKTIPLERMLIETDSPYLAPVPHRGQQNQPAYVRHVAEFLAQLRGESFEQIATQTTANFYHLFSEV